LRCISAEKLKNWEGWLDEAGLILLCVVSKYKGLEPKGRFEVGGGSFCLGFPGKLTNLNSISLSFRQIDNLDSAA
jgi:hypothetical protein